MENMTKNYLGKRSSAHCANLCSYWWIVHKLAHFSVSWQLSLKFVLVKNNRLNAIFESSSLLLLECLFVLLLNEFE